MGPYPPRKSWTAPSRSAFAQARERLGWEVTESLFRAQAIPLAGPAMGCCFWRGRRVMALDGTTFELADLSELWEVFRGQTEMEKRTGAPLPRAVSLSECGTRAIVDAEQAPYASGEQALAEHLARSIELGMLVLADRNFLPLRLFKLYVKAGADLVWRIKSSVATRDPEDLPDASYLATIRSGEKAIRVRVIEYALEGSDEIYRLVTNMLDPNLAPAAELARL